MRNGLGASPQETEEALEELRQKLRDTKARMDAEAQALQGQVRPRLGRGALREE
jgi:hypothetical protein